MDRALYRAFGMDPTMARQVDSIRREIQHEDSRVRNYQWEATRMRKRINEIRAQSQKIADAQDTYDNLIIGHELLSKEFDERDKVLQETRDELQDMQLRVAELSAQETSLRNELRRLDLRKIR